jgi:hypothetical protein
MNTRECKSHRNHHISPESPTMPRTPVKNDSGGWINPTQYYHFGRFLYEKPGRMKHFEAQNALEAPSFPWGRSIPRKIWIPQRRVRYSSSLPSDQSGTTTLTEYTLSKRPDVSRAGETMRPPCCLIGSFISQQINLRSRDGHP